MKLLDSPDAVKLVAISLDAVKLVAIESPYQGNVELNLRYLCACMADSFARGEAPFASHGIYTRPGVLRDEVPEERARGMKAGFAWAAKAEIRAIYLDLGMSDGMRDGRAHAREIGQRIEYRLVPNWM